MPPHRKGLPNPEAPMSREELADLCNQYLADKYNPDGPITANHIRKIEQGITSRPHAPRRQAYRRVLEVQTDSD